jgi:hypothetical protein
MRDVAEVLRLKEQELARVKRQVEALRIVLPLLEAEEQSSSRSVSSLNHEGDHGASLTTN